jgi:hypothetical protein
MFREKPTVTTNQTTQDPWANMRVAKGQPNSLLDLLKTADERLSPLLSALTPAAGSSPPEFRPMPAAPQTVPPLSQQVAEFLASRRRNGGSQGINQETTMPGKHL